MQPLPNRAAALLRRVQRDGADRLGTAVTLPFAFYALVNIALAVLVCAEVSPLHYLLSMLLGSLLSGALALIMLVGIEHETAQLVARAALFGARVQVRIVSFEIEPDLWGSPRLIGGSGNGDE